jgi:hypothetical protein
MYGVKEQQSQPLGELLFTKKKKKKKTTIPQLDHKLQIETHSMQRVTQNSQTTKTHNRNPFLPRLGKINDYSAKSKPILSILESTEMKKSIGTHSFDSRIGKIETQFYRIKEREDFKRREKEGGVFRV